MKRTLLNLVACFMVVIGAFSLSACNKKRNFNGVYKLTYATVLEDNNLVVFDDENEKNNTEIYILIEGNKVTEYIFEKSNSDNKVLLEQNVACEVLPEFYITKENDGKEYYTNFTNLNRLIEGDNLNKDQRWTYVKVNSLPNYNQI